MAIRAGKRPGDAIDLSPLGQAFFKGQWGLAKDFVRARFWLKKIVDGECEHKNLRDPARNKLYPWLRELDGR